METLIDRAAHSERSPCAWFENVVDLSSGRRAGVALVMPGRAASEQLGFACRALGRRVVRLAAPLFIPARRGLERDMLVDGFARAARRLRSRGLSPSLLGAILPVEEDTDAVLIERLAAIGVRVCLDADASVFRGEVGRELVGAARQRQLPLCVSDVRALEDLTEPIRCGASWARGPLLSGSAHEPRSLGEPQRRLVELARRRGSVAAAVETVELRFLSARDSIRATTRALERATERDLMALLEGLDERLGQASTTLAAARTARDSASAAARSASNRLDALLGDVARGEPPRAERVFDAIVGLEEATTLRELSARTFEAEVRHADSLHASALLRVQASLAALSARTRIGGAASTTSAPMAESSRGRRGDPREDAPLSA